MCLCDRWSALASANHVKTIYPPGSLAPTHIHLSLAESRCSRDGSLPPPRASPPPLSLLLLLLFSQKRYNNLVGPPWDQITQVIDTLSWQLAICVRPHIEGSFSAGRFGVGAGDGDGVGVHRLAN